jgi:hypothetical protein
MEAHVRWIIATKEGISNIAFMACRVSMGFRSGVWLIALGAVVQLQMEDVSNPRTDRSATLPSFDCIRLI